MVTVTVATLASAPIVAIVVFDSVMVTVRMAVAKMVVMLRRVSARVSEMVWVTSGAAKVPPLAY